MLRARVVHVTHVGKEQWPDSISLVGFANLGDRLVDSVVGHCARTGRNLHAKCLGIARMSSKSAVLL